MHCCLEFSFKRTMTNESGRVSLPQSGIELLCLFSHNLSACISPTLDDGLQSGSSAKANGMQLLFLGCLPPIQSLLMGDNLINLTGLFLFGITASIFSKDYSIICFNQQVPCTSFKPARKSSLFQSCARCCQTAL